MEFKSILSASASAEVVHDDTWYSVPLSEVRVYVMTPWAPLPSRLASLAALLTRSSLRSSQIDFSRCRKCTPSYRALPRDYPLPPCSERSPAEADVLNNIWVSLPVGSEESYTFRHMRKNQYEEALFRCEDERFEIDMVLDANASTIRVLEPLVEEVGLLAVAEVMTGSLGATAASSNPKNTGLGGSRYQYKFDPRTLSIIHTNAICRVYGDHAQEILHLLKKNPTKTIPVVYKRLVQKDREFRAARNHLNKRWKEVRVRGVKRRRAASI